MTCRWSRHLPQRPLLTGSSGRSLSHWPSVRSPLLPIVVSTTQLIDRTRPKGTLLTPALHWATRHGALPEDVALRLAVYAAAEKPV
ncbi:hypothetical protein GCM10010195_67410 [Kitasatospora griseola]|nr:hypothetical protein GCM10010195_67410 [Kitasatospora griseola]